MMRVGAGLRRQWVRVRARPMHWALSVACVALGVGATVAVWSVADAALFRPLPYAGAERLVMLNTTHAGPSGSPARMLVSALELEVVAGSEVFEGVAGMRAGGFDVTGAGEAERVAGAWVTTDLLAVLGLRPVFGRGFEEADASARVALISDGLWRRRYGGDASIVGRTIELDGRVHEVIGVLREADALPVETAVWVPLDVRSLSWEEKRAGNLLVVGRLREGVSRAEAERAMHSAAAEVARLDAERSAGKSIVVRSLREPFVGEARGVLLALVASVLLVLGISCLNVANLSLGRLHAESRALAIRRALGATRGDVALASFRDSLMLAAVGGAAGVVLAAVLVPWFVSLSGLSGPGLADALNGRALIASVVVVVGTAVSFGAAPALRAARSDVYALLREEGRGSAGGVERRWHGVLIVAQTGLGLLLILTAVLMTARLRGLASRDPGYDVEGVLTFRLGASPERYAGTEPRWAFFDRVLASARALPGVVAAGASSALPVGDPGLNASFSVEAHVPVAPGATETARARIVSPGYFEAMGIGVRSGRDFVDADGASATPVAVVSRALAERYWPGRSAIGERIKRRTYDSPFPWLTVVGVVDDVRDGGLDEETGATIYFPLAQWSGAFADVMTIALRHEGEAGPLVAALRERLAAIDPLAPVFRIATPGELLRDSLRRERFVSALMSAFAMLGVVLLVSGLYGVVSQTVTDRRREIGIRLALGATPFRILLQVAGEGVLLVAAGVVAGSVAAALLLPAVARFAADGEQLPASAWLAGIASLLLIGTLAAALPARRASRLDPTANLRD